MQGWDHVMPGHPAQHLQAGAEEMLLAPSFVTVHRQAGPSQRSPRAKGEKPSCMGMSSTPHPLQ